MPAMPSSAPGRPAEQQPRRRQLRAARRRRRGAGAWAASGCRAPAAQPASAWRWVAALTLYVVARSERNASTPRRRAPRVPAP
jgi:hypothetical protein